MNSTIKLKNIKHSQFFFKVKKLCENCGKLAKHKNSECPKLLGDDVEEIPETENIVEDTNVKKKYVPVHLSGKYHLKTFVLTTFRSRTKGILGLSIPLFHPFIFHTSAFYHYL